MARAYNLAIPLFILFAFAWLGSGAYLQLSWATFCASVLHMSDVAIIQIHVVAVWFFLVSLIAVFFIHAAVVAVPQLRRRLQPHALCHIAVLASLYVIAVYGVIVSKPKFQKLYRVFHERKA